MKRPVEELEDLKKAFHQSILQLIQKMKKGSPEHIAAEELKGIWDQICALEATLDIFGDVKLAKDIEAGLADIAADRVVSLEEIQKKYFTPKRGPKKGDA